MRHALLALVCALGCAHTPTLTQEQGDALTYVWRVIYNRLDAPPKLHVIAPNCVDGKVPGTWNSGKCAGGAYDGINAVVTMGPGQMWHETALCHELLHAIDDRAGVIDVCAPNAVGCILGHTATFIAADTACRARLQASSL